MTVSGRSSVIDALDEKTISGSIDLTDLKLGAHNVLITFELDDGYGQLCGYLCSSYH